MELVTLGNQNYNNLRLERGHRKEDFIDSSWKNDHSSQILEQSKQEVKVLAFSKIPLPQSKVMGFRNGIHIIY